MNKKIKLFQKIISLSIHAFFFLFLFFLNLLGISHFFFEHENIIKYSFINYYRVASGSMEPNIKKNDIVIVRKMKNKEYSKELKTRWKAGKEGEIIIFKADKTKEPDIIIHRVVKFDEEKQQLTTKGDNNENEDNWSINRDQIIAIYCFKIPTWGQFIFFLIFIIYFSSSIFWPKKEFFYNEKK
ncbi:signal peptidase I [Candidatus Phytoplasma pini]|uniref:Signal peptidase I n=1 Tax=Candidatus Phytoplasma pini TaxID=267362 RepID=A0A559KJ09_9MOLU|nr:signal peptidase I [Candidatus Phytoplasma pini]TVY12068.1 hypothetical protein MDPP_00387 [Candidatus Phytoplasma pini]